MTIRELMVMVLSSGASLDAELLIPTPTSPADLAAMEEAKEELGETEIILDNPRYHTLADAQFIERGSDEFIVLNLTGFPPEVQPETGA